jgi:long-chain acyl-CoA synthetase
MSLTAALTHSRTRNPEKSAIVFGEQVWTYAEFDELTDNVARNLLAAGLEPGDRVAFHLLNGPEIAFGYFGCLKAGGIAVPINTRLKGPEIDYILRHSGSAFYIGQPELYVETSRACSAMGSLELRYLTGDKQGNQTSSFSELLRPVADTVPLPKITRDQVAAILYTSGTTSRPKGVIHSHESLAQTALAMRHMRLDQDQVAVVMSSMTHLIGFGMMFLSGLLNGATVVITQPFDFKGVLDAYERWRCTYTTGLPVMFHGLLKEQTESPRHAASGRFFFCGGDSVTPTLQERFQAAFAPVCEVYGMTEITPAAWNQPGDVTVGSIGRPGEGIGLRLIDSDGRDVKSGEVGEICVQGPHLMTGYWQDPNATAAALRNGWFHTGDLARCDAGGVYWFAGRKKEIIIRGGSNISPQEVEAALCQHPAVSEVGVVGRPDHIWGEVVIAFVVLRTGQAVTEAELIAFARERLADYKTPEYVIFRDELPKGPTGKIQRRALRAEEHAFAPLS